MPLPKLKIDDSQWGGSLQVNPVQLPASTDNLRVAQYSSPVNQTGVSINIPKYNANLFTNPETTQRSYGFGNIKSDALTALGSQFGYNNGSFSLNPISNLQNIRTNYNNLFNDIGQGIGNTQKYQAVKNYTPTVNGQQIPVGQFATGIVESPANTINRLGNVGIPGRENMSYNGNPTQIAGQLGEDALNLITAGRGGSIIAGAKLGGSAAVKQVARVLGEDIATGAGYGVATTAQDANATGMDYVRNTALGAGLAPVIHGTIEGGIHVATRTPAAMRAAQSAVNDYFIARGIDPQGGSIMFDGTLGFKQAQEAGLQPTVLSSGEKFYEYSDHKAELKPTIYDAASKFVRGEATPSLRVSDILTHEEMLKNNPGMMDVGVQFRIFEDPNNVAAYQPGSNRMEIGIHAIERAMASDPNGYWKEDLRNTIIHELTHAEEVRAGTKGTAGHYRVDPTLDRFGYLHDPMEQNAFTAESRSRLTSEQQAAKPFYDSSNVRLDDVQAQMIYLDGELAKSQYDNADAMYRSREGLPAEANQPKDKATGYTDNSTTRTSRNGTKHVSWSVTDSEGYKHNVIFSRTTDGKVTVSKEYININGEVSSVENLGSFDKVSAKYGTKDPEEIALRAASGEAKAYDKNGDPIWTTSGKINAPSEIIKSEGPGANKGKDSGSSAKQGRAKQDPTSTTSKKGTGKDPYEKIVKVRSTEVKPLRTVRVVRDELKQTSSPKKEAARALKATKAYGRQIEREIKAIEKSKRSPAMKQKMIEARVQKGTQAAQEAAAISLHLDKLNEFRRATGLESRQAKANPKPLDEAKLKSVSEMVDQADELIYGTSMTDAKAAHDTGTKTAGAFMSFMRNLFQEKPNDIASSLLSEGNFAQRKSVRSVQALYGDFAKSTDQVSARRRLKGGIAQANELSRDVYKKGAGMVDRQKESLNRIWDYMQPDTAKDPSKIEFLDPQEKAAAEWARSLADIYHTANYQMGVIGESTYREGLGKYLTRSYEQYEFAPEVNSMFKSNKAKMADELSKARKNVTDKMLDDLLRDPMYALARQARFTMVNKTVHQWASWAVKQGNKVRDLGEGAAGDVQGDFIKMSEHGSLGALSGKWVRRDVVEELKGFYYDQALLQHAQDFGNAWERSALRRGAKSLKTIFSPIQHVVNRAYNYGVATMNGINPATFAINESLARKMIKANDPLVVALKRDGVIGGDIATTELQNNAKGIHIVGEKQGKISQGAEKAADTYALADDGAKLATILTWTKRGYSLAEAVTRAERSMQDYSSVGKAWDASAKIPIFGKAFGRFTGDFIRVANNTMVDHPLRVVTGLAALQYLQTFASQASGETPEDRKTRETRAGAGHIPILGRSTEFMTPWGALDIRRFMGPVALGGMNDDGTSIASGLSVFNPFDVSKIGGKITTSDGETRTDVRSLATDPLIGPLVSIATDMNFSGDHIRKPQEYSQPGKDVSIAEQAKNVALQLYHGYNVPSANDAEDLLRAMNGMPTFANSQKPNAKPADPLSQAARTFTGIRVTQYGPEQAQKARQGEQYGNAITSARESLPTRDDINQFNDYMGRQKNDKGQTIQESPLESVKNNQILLGNNSVRNAVKTAMAAQDKHDPLWDLPDDKLKQFLASQIALPGSAERWKIGQDNPWIEDFQQKRSDYFMANIKTGSSIPNPETPAYPTFDATTKASLKEYNNVAQQDKGAYLADHPEVVGAFTALGKYSNQIRAARKAPELDEYPQAPAGVKPLIDAYSALPKGEGANGKSPTRSNWIKSHPNEWAAMTDYFTTLSVYNLAKEGARVQLKGVDVTQDFLKNAYSLGQYSIGKNADGTYSLGSGGSGSSSRYASAPRTTTGMSSRSGVSKPSSGKISISNPSGKAAGKRIRVKGIPKGRTRLY